MKTPKMFIIYESSPLSVIPAMNIQLDGGHVRF